MSSTVSKFTRYRLVFRSCLAVVVIVLVFLLISNKESIQPQPSIDPIHEIGLTCHTKTTVNNKVITANYPVTGNSAIDTITTCEVNLLINKCSDIISCNQSLTPERSLIKNIHIDYESYKASNELASVKLILYCKIGDHFSQIYSSCINYNMLDNRRLFDHDIFRKDYMNVLSSLCSKRLLGDKTAVAAVNNIIKKQLTFNQIILKKDGVVLSYLDGPTSKAQQIELSYNELEGYINYKGQKEQDSDGSIVYPAAHRPKRYKFDSEKPKVALTFDDGPHSVNTPLILDILKKNNSVATFFVLGCEVSNHAEIIQRMINEGNEVGNHSFNHYQLTKISDKLIEKELNSTDKAIYKICGRYPCVFRPCYGSYNSRVIKKAGLPAIIWSIDTLDWKSRNPEKVFNIATTNIKDGDIILFHDTHATTVEAIEKIVPALIDKNFQLVTVSELMYAKGIEPAVKAYYRISTR